ncbi:hypothetical protein BCBMB205_11880 [Bacillus sp. CN2]|nr:hypothetical protein BCBMB205_11880 [Bacillus velezensis]ARZ57520.1 hypothetical protein BAGQ_1286 [Bacillus velezensis]GFR54016.1 hypothetical protein BCBMB205_11880 [Bacillus sp. CN2]
MKIRQTAKERQISIYCDGYNAGAWNFPFIRSYVRGTKRLLWRRKRND